MLRNNALLRLSYVALPCPLLNYRDVWVRIGERYR